VDPEGGGERKGVDKEDLYQLAGISYGDAVVFEVEGKFMSVYQEWWMAWSYSGPKRSGVFVLEEAGGEESDEGQESKQMSVLLRSHKYPGCELGVGKQYRKKGENKKDRYVGLQQIDSTTTDSWLYPCEFQIFDVK